MEPENNQAEGRFAPLQKVTPLSKYLAMTLFIIMPFIGGWIGYTYSPEKVVEVENIVIKEVFVENEFKNQELVKETAIQCEVDSDCVLVQPDCEDCNFAATASAELEEFQSEKRMRCELNPPKVQCDTVFDGSVKCIKNTCQLVE